MTIATKSPGSSRDVAIKQYGEDSIGSPRDFVEPVATKRFNNALSLWALLAASGLLAMWFLGPAQAKQQQSALHVSARELRILRRRARRAMQMCCTKLSHSRDSKLDVYVSTVGCSENAAVPTVLCYAADGETASSWGSVAALLHPHARVLCVARIMPPSHDCRETRQSATSQAADMEYACQAAGVQGAVITVLSGPSSFAGALFHARAANGDIPGLSSGHLLCVDAQWMPSTLRAAHVPAVVSASRQLHQPGLLEKLQLPPQQQHRDAMGMITPQSVLGKGLDLAQRFTGGQQSGAGQKGDRGVAAMNQRQPLLAQSDIEVLREVLRNCSGVIQCTQLLTAASALPFNVSTLDNAQVFTTRAHGAGVLSEALRGQWGLAVQNSAAERGGMEAAAAASARQAELQRAADRSTGPQAAAAAFHAQEGSAAQIAGIKATLRPLQTLGVMVGAACGLLPVQHLAEVKAAAAQLEAAAMHSEVFLVSPVEPNVYHVPLQLPGAVLQALLPFLPSAAGSSPVLPQAQLLQAVPPRKIAQK